MKKIASRRKLDYRFAYPMLLFLPMEVIGYTVLGYPVSLGLIGYLLWSAYLSFSGRIRVHSDLFIVTAGFIFWILLTAMVRHPVMSYLPSTILTLLFLVPFFIGLGGKFETKPLIKMVLVSAIPTFIYLPYEYLTYSMGFTPVWEMFGIKAAEFAVASDESVLRFQAFMSEPSTYAIYLCFYYAVVDMWGARVVRKSQYLIILKGLTVVALVLTQSLSGIVMFVIYIALSLSGYLQRKSRSKRVIQDVGTEIKVNAENYKPISNQELKSLKKARSERVQVKILVAVIILVATVFLSSQSGRVFFENITTRIGETGDKVEQGDVEGSEGTRINAIKVMFDYWGQASGIQLLMGEGFANPEKWLEEHYAGERSELAKGDIANIFAYLGISVGMIGLLLYLAMLVVLRRGVCRKIPGPYFALWIAAHFATGQFVHYTLWAYLYIGIIGAYEKKQRVRIRRRI